MAVVTNNPSSLKLKFDCGLNEETGKRILKSKSYSGVKHDALDQDVYDVGASIASLQVNTLTDVLKIDSSTLSE